jgi:hypothetical protein
MFGDMKVQSGLLCVSLFAYSTLEGFNLHVDGLVRLQVPPGNKRSVALGMSALIGSIIIL